MGGDLSALMPRAFTGVLDYLVYVLISIHLQAKKDARHSSKDDCRILRASMYESTASDSRLPKCIESYTLSPRLFHNRGIKRVPSSSALD